MRRRSIAENLVIFESKRKGLANNKHLGLSYSVSGKPFQEKHSLVRQIFKYKDVLSQSCLKCEKGDTTKTTDNKETTHTHTHTVWVS